MRRAVTFERLDSGDARLTTRSGSRNALALFRERPQRAVMRMTRDAQCTLPTNLPEDRLR